MHPLLVATLVFVVLPTFYVVLVVRLLVDARREIERAWSELDAELGERRARLRELIDSGSVSGGCDFEAKLVRLIEFVAGSSSPTPGTERIAAERALDAVLLELSSPSQQADANAGSIQATAVGEIDQWSQRLEPARERYNRAARNLNMRVETLPSNAIAALLRITAVPYFKAPPRGGD